jgi:hypothetical protein
MSSELAKQIISMINYHGGQEININEALNNSNEIDETQLRELIERSNATHAFTTKYDNLTQQIDKLNVIKLITPDWLLDSIDKNKVINDDIEQYNPKYLLDYNDNKSILNEYEQKEQERMEKEAVAEKQQDESNDLALNNSTLQNKKIDILENVKTQIILDDFNDNKEETTVTNITNNNPPPMPILIDTINENLATEAPITPTKAKNKRSKPNPTNTITTTTASLNDMNEIFQSVIGGDSIEEDANKQKIPVYLNMTKPLNRIQFPSTNCVFDEDSTSQDTYFIQENSHLIQFDCCLLGCVFHLKPSESYYTPDCLNDWQKVIERFGGKVATDYQLAPIKTGTTIKAINQQQEITHVLCPNRITETYKKAMEDRKRVVTPYWLEDVLQEQKLRPPWLAYHFPSPYEFKDGPLTNHVITLHGFTGKEKLILKTLIWLLNGKYSSHLSNINSFLISKNSDGIKVEKAKQWKINVVNGIWINELYLGNLKCLIDPLDERYKNLNVNHFGFEPAFVAEFMDQWKQLIKLPIERIREANTMNGNSNSNSPFKQINNRSPLKRYNRSLSGSPTNEMNPAKSMKTDNDIDMTTSNDLTAQSISWIKPQSSIPIVLFTGFDPNDLIQYQRDVIGLGGILAKQVGQTTHLIVDRIERTAKLLKCISTVDHIVHIKWLIESKLNGKFLDPMNFQIKDDRFEKHYSCCLKDSLLRAKQNKPLFSGYFFYMSPSVRPSYGDLEDMIRSAGGVVLRDVPTLQKFSEPFQDDRTTVSFDFFIQDLKSFNFIFKLIFFLFVEGFNKQIYFNRITK